MTKLKKVFFLLLITVLLLIAGVMLFLFIQKDFIKNQSILALNKQLDTAVEIKGNIDLTFLSTFPNITLSFNEVYIADKLRTNDTLAGLENVRLQLNTFALLQKDVSIDGIYARDGFLRLFTDESGLSNYNILKNADDSDSGNLLQLKKIALHNVSITYDDRPNQFFANVLSIESEIAGSFYNEDFDLNIATDLFNHNMLVDGTPLFPAKSLSGKLKLKYTGADGCIQFDNNTLRIQHSSFNVQGSICTKSKQIDLSASADGNDLQEALSLVPEEWLDTQTIEGNGAFEIKASFKGELNKPVILLNFGIKDGTLAVQDKDLLLSNLRVEGSFLKSANNEQSLAIRDFSAFIDDSELSGNFNIPNLNDLNIKAKLHGILSKQLLNTFLPASIRIETGQVEVSELDLHIHQNKKDSLWQLLNIEGSLSLDSLEGKITSLDLPFSCIGKLTGEQNQLMGKDLKLQIGQNDLSFNGSIKNLIALILNQKNNNMLELEVSGELKSNYFNLNDFIQNKTNTSSAEKKAISFPPIFGKVSVMVNELVYQQLSVQDIEIQAIANNTAYTFNILKGKTLGGNFYGQFLSNVNQNNFEINLNCDIQGVDIQKLFEAFNNFGQEDMGSDNIKGTMNSHLAFSASWKDFSEFDADNFIMQCHLELKEGELINFAPLMSLSGKLDVEQLEHLYFTDLAADITIKDQWIHIPMTTIQTNLLSLDAGGKHSFQNEIDYKLILNLKNLLAAKFKKNKTTEEDFVNDAKGGINLYISMTGTVDNPIIKYDRQGVKEKMKEDFKAEKQEFKNLFKKEVKSEFEKNELKFEELKEEDKYLEWED